MNPPEGESGKASKVRENPDTVERLRLLDTLGKRMLEQTRVVRDGVSTADDVQTAKHFLAEAIHQMNPKNAWQALWEHYIISAEMGKRIAEAAKEKGVDVHPAGIQFATWMHDVARLATHEFLRNDAITERLQKSWGIPESMRKNSPSLREFLGAAEKLSLDEEQKRFKKSLTPKQEKQARDFYDSLSPTQKILNYCDSLGKRGPKGLFDSESYIEYLKSQESRYGQTSPWPSVSYAIDRREAASVLYAYVIEKTAEWLQEQGVDLAAIHRGLKEYGPKFVLFVRHGEVDNPKNIVYTRDEHMDPKDIMYLSSKGHVQMHDIADIIQRSKFNVVTLRKSPLMRARESGQALASALRLDAEHIKDDHDLSELDAREPYEKGMTMDELEKQGGDVYSLPNTERPVAVQERMQRAFAKISSQLKTGETAIAISHGDPLAWFFSSLYRGPDAPIVEPKDLRKEIYPAKGSCNVVILDGEGKYFTMYSLTDQAASTY